MPKDFRKRGKKHKKSVLVDEPTSSAVIEQERGDEDAGPSWIVSSHTPTNPEAPFGYVDADVKAYFRTVDVQLREWQENDAEEGLDESIDANENKRAFLLAALQEMSGKERELATDPDCSTVLERMVYSMDDFVRRVFMDSLSGSYELLVKHRFASHVVQTMITAAADTIGRESRGILPSLENREDKGELRTATQLILDIAEELLPSISTLVLDAFASHVIRALFVVLCPSLFSSETSTVRSKKSSTWKAKQGQFRSVFSGKGKEKAIPSTANAPEFRAMARRMIQEMRSSMTANEVRSLATNKSSSPVLQMAVQLEADLGIANEVDSLMDSALVGLISQQKNDPDVEPESSDFLGTLLRDVTSSHLLETLIACCTPHIFPILWSVYFAGKLARLSVHPVANFVVAKAIERLSTDELVSAVGEMESSWAKIRTTRPGILRALVDRSAKLAEADSVVCMAIYSAFEIEKQEDYPLLVPCILRLQTTTEYRDAITATGVNEGEVSSDAHAKKRKRSEGMQDHLEPKMGGALLLQSMLKLTAPHVEPILESIQSMSTDELVSMAHHAISSHVFDALLESTTISPKQKRAFIQRFLGDYHRLVDDRIGSRVADRCWATADTYLKEKIARSLLPHESFLAGSYYGKFFARNLNLYLLQRRPDEWRAAQTSKSKAIEASAVAANKPDVAQIAAIRSHIHGNDQPLQKKKRKHSLGQQDEIDVLFSGTLGRKVKRAALSAGVVDTVDPKEGGVVPHGKNKAKSAKEKRNKDQVDDGGLAGVLGAIRVAPKGDERRRRK